MSYFFFLLLIKCTWPQINKFLWTFNHNEKKENDESSTVFWFSRWVVPVHQMNLSISWNNLILITIYTFTCFQRVDCTKFRRAGYLYIGLVALSLNHRISSISSLLPEERTSQDRNPVEPSWATVCVTGTKYLLLKPT